MVTDGVKKIKKDGQNERNNSVTTAVTTAATTTTTNTSTRMSDIDAATASKVFKVAFSTSLSKPKPQSSKCISFTVA